MVFELCQGVGADNLSGIYSAYKTEENGLSAVLSCELIYPAINGILELLDEPVFFFLELPCTEDEEKKLRKSKSDPFHYNVYYLDGCTIPVAKAIMKRYGELLINDGISRFGFGSHKSGDEIYCLNYQEFRIYGNSGKYEKVLKKLKVQHDDSYKSLWDNFSDETPGNSMMVEINGESVYNIVENLKSEGMYLAETRSE